MRRDLRAPAPDTVWAGDMTEFGTDEGKLYLATVIDLYSRRLLGFAMGVHHDAELVVAVLNMAAACAGDVSGVIFHSDRGSEYVSKRFGDACRRWGVWQSMGRVGSCSDNAVSEAFNSVLKWSTSTGSTSAPGPRRASGPARGSRTSTALVGCTACVGSSARWSSNGSTGQVLQEAAWELSTLRAD
ncbi:transposase [Streptomyces pratisoli]